MDIGANYTPIAYANVDNRKIALERASMTLYRVYVIDKSKPCLEGIEIIKYFSNYPDAAVFFTEKLSEMQKITIEQNPENF